MLIVSSMPGSIIESYLPKASATAGDGHMLLFWDGGAAPSGWTCVSCSIGDDFYQTFVRGNDTYGGTGGSVDHSHTTTNSIDNSSLAVTEASGGSTVSDSGGHSHSLTASIDVASNLPAYRELQIIRHNTNGEPTVIPTGAIAMFDNATLPTDWSSYSAQNGSYVRGESTAGSTGGSNTHSHNVPITIGTATGSTQGPRTNGQTSLAALSTHTHTATGSSDTINNEPPYIEVIFGKTTASSAPPNGLIGMWDDDEPGNWAKLSGSTGAFYQNFVKGSASYGSTGGTTTHAHADNNITSSAAIGTGNYRNGGSGSDGAHTHNINIDNYSTENHLPPYRDVIIAKRVPQPAFEQSAYRLFSNTNTADVGSPLASQDTSASSPRQGKPFRLRISLHVDTANLGIGGKLFKLQYSARSGTCDVTFSGESYSDVTTSGPIQFYDNPGVGDGVAMTSNVNDPTHGGDTKVTQTYEEANNFTNTSAIVVGEDGVWDFALIDVSATASSSYCFRVVASGGELLDTYSVIPEIITDDGQGHMLLFWDGGAAPSGWTCVSCSSSDDFYQRFIRGEASYGGTGGSVNHTHTGNGSVAPTAGTGIEVDAGSSVSTGVHTHSISPTIGNSSNLPQYRQLKVIRANSSGVPSTIPAGAIAMFDATVPGGWTRYSAQDGNYIRAEGSVATGGSNTHGNPVSGNTTTAPQSSTARTSGSTTSSATVGHFHAVTGNLNSTNHEPPFIETILGKINVTASVPTGIITMWDNPVPGIWTNVSTSGQPFHQRFVKPSASYGTTGGSTSHSHTDSVIVSQPPSSTGTLRSGSGNADGAHTHNVTISSISTANHLPPYINVIFAKLATVNNPPNNPATLDQKRTSDFSSVSVGGYANSGQVQFTAQASDSDNPDSLQLCVEVQQIGTAFVNTETSCGSSVAYGGSPVTVTVTISGFTDGSSYHWQARVKDGGGATSSWVSFGGNAESAADFIMDSSDPSGSVYDGPTVSVDADYNGGELDQLEANWDITDSGSGVGLFEYSIGTTVGATDIQSWTSNGTTPSVTAGSLTLQTSQIYYFNIRTTDNADNQSVTNSDGIRVAPTLSFAASPGSVVFDNLNSANSYTSSKSTTLTTSTNAYNGYAIRAFATGVLTSPELDTINFFEGGSYVAPDAWLGGDTGYGYTSNDNDIQGINKFNPVTCAGGGSSPCYAPFTTSAPGDIVADHTSLVTGTAIINENFIVTHRVTTGSSQNAGTYSSEVVYVVTAIY